MQAVSPDPEAGHHTSPVGDGPSVLRAHAAWSTGLV